MIHGPGDSGDNLDEVKVSATKIDTAPAPSNVAASETLPEITVQGVRIPWWVWGMLGALAVTMLINTKGRR